MIDTQAIRNKILDLAMCGKLTEQLPEDGTAEELYRQIQAEKQSLIKAGKIKKEEPLPEIAEKEIPFEIPTNWKWIALGNITSKISSGNTPPGGKKSDVYVPNGFPLFREQNIYDDGIRQAGLVYISEKLLETRQNSTVKAKDILLNITGGSIGRCALVPNNFDRGSINQHILIIRPVEPEIRFYIHMLICGPYIQSHIKNNAVGDKDGFSGGRCKSIFVPLPPLAEQHRIVARIEQAFSALDTIDALQAKYADNLTVLKSKLIDAAIQGKLTEQLPEDGTAEKLYQQIQAEKHALIKTGKIKKEKPLPEISADEIPFEIPSNWCWCRLQSLFNFIDYRGATPNKISEGVPFITAKNVRQGYIDYSISEYISEEDYQKRQLRGISHKGDLLFTTEAPMGYAAIADLDRFSAGQRLITLQQYTDDHLLENKYYMYAISTPFFQKQLDDKCSGTTVKGIKADRLKQFLIPLPPLAEQKRIVESLDKFLAVCDKF